MRNVSEAIQEGKEALGRNPRYEMSIPELELFRYVYHNNTGEDGLIDTILNVFHYGVTIGMRIAKKEARKEGKK